MPVFDRKSGLFALVFNGISTAGHKGPNGAGFNYGGYSGNIQLL